MSALTKIFIVLQLVCSLVVAVVLVVALRAQANYKQNAENNYTAMVAAQAAVAQKVGEASAADAKFRDLDTKTTAELGKRQQIINDQATKLQAAEFDRDQAKVGQSGESAKVTQLTSANESMSKEIARLNPEIARLASDNAALTQKNAELNRQVNEAVTQVDFAGRQIKGLQEEIARLQTMLPKGGASGGTDTGTVANLTVQTPAQINGKITSAAQAAGHTLVELPLGARDGVKVGTQFVVSRDAQYIGDVKVTKVTPDSSVAESVTVKQGQELKAGDIVTSGNPQ